MPPMLRPKTLPTPDGVVHVVWFLDAIYWRPACGFLPYTKPKGWKTKMNTFVTCLLCISNPIGRD